jgi:hypothetical protein
MISIAEAVQGALTFPEVIQSPHFARISFRVKQKIFITLDPANQRATIKLSPGDQSLYADTGGQIIFPVPGAWGKRGWTHIELRKVRKNLFRSALESAYYTVAPKKLRRQQKDA